ncbi:hypothetical protein A2671_00580 [Candidatus Kaiserbacteria bacterium RIFCSPHIGHO2_01_FULL_49_13]|uniref:Uncharacterized protein n=1 Tax=Candidatus Kaiserbacteria bacterium RIFCSPHIGHO2_01_FULL_49_13 TaxID=1798477 RepID=A0A1F6CDM9_9BACT|nr:MAG: hypothetical protein A2671_00580 [Candidatus Kaiserbacteria bacterium RIFCSPHIGHO2_01_FULL_49_13]
MSFSEGDWVEWIDPPQDPRHREAIKDLIKKNGLGPFKVVRVRDAHLHPQGGQMLWIEIRGVSHSAHSSWYKKCDEDGEQKLNRKFPEESEVRFETKYGDAKRNGQKATVLEHLPGQSGGFAHLIKFESNGDMQYVYAQELFPWP